MIRCYFIAFHVSLDLETQVAKIMATFFDEDLFQLRSCLKLASLFAFPLLRLRTVEFDFRTRLKSAVAVLVCFAKFEFYHDVLPFFGVLSGQLFSKVILVVAIRLFSQIQLWI